MRQFNRRISFLITVLKIPFHLLLIGQFHIIMDFWLILYLKFYIDNNQKALNREAKMKFVSQELDMIK